MSGIAYAALRPLIGLSLKRSITTAACCDASSSSWRQSNNNNNQAVSNNNFSTTSNNNENESTNESTNGNNNSDNHRQRALSLYRQLLRGAERMPTPNRQNYIKRKTRAEFKRHVTLTDTEEIEFQLRLADTNLDTVLVQAEHLCRLFNDPEYQNYN